MTDVVGTAEVRIGGDSKALRASLEALRTSFRRLGNQISQDLTAPLNKRIRTALTRMRRTFSETFRQIRGDAKILAGVVNESMRRVAKDARDALVKKLSPALAFAQKAFSATRRAVDAFGDEIRDVGYTLNNLVGTSEPVTETLARQFRNLYYTVDYNLRSMRDSIRDTRDTIRDGFSLASAYVAINVEKIRGGIRRISQGFDSLVKNARVSLTVASLTIRSKLDEFFSNTRTGRILKAAGDVGRDMGRVLSAAAKFSLGKAQQGVSNALGRMRIGINKDSALINRALSRIADSGVVSRIQRGARRIGRAFDGPVLRVWYAAEAIKKAIGSIDNPLKTLGAKAKVFLKPFERAMKRTARNVRASWLRMDGTVKLVIVSILIAGQPLAAVMAGISAAAVGMAASLAGAAFAASALVGVIAPLGLALAAAVKGMKDLDQYSASASTALEGLKNQFNDVAVPSLMKEWANSLGPFFNTLKGFLSADLFAGLGEGLREATEGLTAVLQGTVGDSFKTALAGPLTDAFSSIVGAIAPLASALLSFMTATAPAAAALAELFRGWAEGLAETFGNLAGSAEFQAFLGQAVIAIQNVFALLGAVKDALFTVFEAGIGPGTQFLAMLTGIVREFDNWMNTEAGQAALKGFFDNISAVMPPLFDLIGAIGKALSNLVTPSVINSIGEFLGALGNIMPVLGDLIAVLGEAQIIEVLSAAVVAFGEVLSTLGPPLADVFRALAGELLVALEQNAPMFRQLGAAVGSLLTALVPLIPPILQAAFTLIGSLLPAIQAIIPAFVTLVNAIAPLLPQLIDALLPVIERLAPVFAALITAIAPLVTQIVEALLPILEPLIELFLTVFEVLADSVIPIIEELLPIIIDLVTTALEPLETILELVNPLITLMGEIISTLIGWVSDLIGWVVDWIKENKQVQEAIRIISDRLSTMIDWVTGVVDAITEWLDSVDIGAWFDDAWDTIKDWFTDVTGWVDDLWSTISDTFSDIGNAIKNAFTTAFNAVANAWNNTVGSLSWTTPDWIPLLGGKTVRAPRIPTFASGGIADRASIFGEAGREAAVPLDRPLSQVNPEVRYLSAIAQGKDYPGKGGGTSIAAGAITVYAPESNPALVAESVLDRIVAYAR